jgi:hypothetical protein
VSDLPKLTHVFRTDFEVRDYPHFETDCKIESTTVENELVDFFLRSESRRRVLDYDEKRQPRGALAFIAGRCGDEGTLDQIIHYTLAFDADR